ncbi:hypothetical protein [Candidatus Magnetobacterium casense]|uniref:Uncharacterized protein n=1 Tax=Candidatus Magnetobacterium casense TaxID=1455061 RepID=A0ABS6S289_9BACT|nr:hypothetical protein [Candidatus Magnetobacterium casensis]MBV6342960.1 hypothetical protein [Candidatus Magnetobacterium casensis]
MTRLANYSTTVPASRSINEIQNILVAHGAQHILLDYNDGEPVGLAFIVNTPYGDTPFKLPANIGKVSTVLNKQRRRTQVSNEVAARVAWRILKDWVRSQMAILETEMVTIDQVFLPYMQVGASGKILYEVMLDHHLQLPKGAD